ncbi:MAG: DUF1573 domain-containing protein [Crocinitomicaceae bacterium]|nr:DUF1573 domain-containing protein [Crocinitomicaceae bacterium]
MKKSILSLLVLVFAGMTSTAMAQEISLGAAIEFEKDLHDYGTIPHKGNGTYAFEFTNTGSDDLLITNAKGSCGCTVPSWPKTPIAPGASAKIEVTYDTKRFGAFSKSVTITSNAVNTPVKVIRIKGSVLAAEVVEEVPVLAEVVEAPPVPEVPAIVVPMTKAELKAEKKRLKKEAKAKKKAAKIAMKEEKKALKAEAKLAKEEAKNA